MLRQKSNKLIQNYNKIKDKLISTELELKKIKNVKNSLPSEKSEDIFLKCLNEVRKEVIKRKLSSNYKTYNHLNNSLNIKRNDDKKSLNTSKKSIRPSTANALQFSNELNEIAMMNALQLELNAP